jgi:hypothetical protein
MIVRTSGWKFVAIFPREDICELKIAVRNVIRKLFYRVFIIENIGRLRSFKSMLGEFSREFAKVASESFDFWVNISSGYFANRIPRGSEGSRASSTRGSNTNVPEAQSMVGFREQSQLRLRANWQSGESLV